MVSSTRATLQGMWALLGTFRKKIRLGPEKSKNVPKTAKIKGYNTRYLAFPGPGLRMPWKVIGKESCGLERIYRFIYVQFEAISCFTRNEQMGCLEAIRGNANGVTHTRNVTRHFNTLTTVLG